MTDPTPPAPRAESVIDYRAQLAERRPMHDRPDPSSWFITHGIGKPAAGTYTEVAFTDAALGRVEGTTNDTLPEHVLDTVVRRVAVDLYGTAWAFHYRPDSYAEAVERWNLRLRERVVISSIEVYA